MKPHVICHMVASIDGRTLTSRWRPEDAERRRQFEPLHDRLGVDAWLVGRITGQEYAKRDAYPHQTGQRYPREAWFARRDAAAYGISLDAQGKQIHDSSHRSPDTPRVMIFASRRPSPQ